MLVNYNVVSAGAAVAAAIISSAALGFAIIANRNLRRSEQRSACFALHQLWFSANMMDARTYASDILDLVMRGERPISAFTTDKMFIASLSRVEHFVVDLGRLLDAQVVCRDLATALFAANVNSWLDRLASTVYDGKNKLSFHPGKSPEHAMRDFANKLQPVRRKLGTTTGPRKLSLPRFLGRT
jgi:hypothetical protein